MPSAGKRPKRHGAEGSGQWARIVAYAVRRDSGRCWVCGHFGATTGDHVIPVTERPDLALEVANVRAAHGYPRACPECTAAAVKRPGGRPVYCNEVKSSGSAGRARRIIEERTGLKLTATEKAVPRQEGRDVW